MIDIIQLPGEPARNFAILCSYARTGPSRSLRRFASEIHLPVPTLRSWSARFRWPIRLDDFDLRVAREEFRLISLELQTRAIDWAVRHEKLREEEYETGMALISRAREFMNNPRLVASLSEIAEMLSLASELARRACGVFPQENPAETLRRLQIKEMVERIYADTCPPRISSDCLSSGAELGSAGTERPSTQLRTVPQPRVRTLPAASNT